MSYKLKQMMSWMRPSGSKEAKIFAEAYLEPICGPADAHGNYVKVMGKNPKVAFASHYDTVHSEGGIQKVYSDHKEMWVEDSDCLGADCTTGIYIMLEMIQEGIEGVYCFFADEEVGCVGSSAMAQDLANCINSGQDHPLSGVSAMISFDRFGENSIITHQMGHRTCSDDFAKWLADELEMQHGCDTGGSYTDSNEFAHLIPECTNLSVGYMKQHSKNEFQDLEYLSELLYNIRFVEWEKAVVMRDPAESFMAPYTYGHGSYVEDDPEVALIETLVYENPSEVAELLAQLGYTSSSLIDELQVDHPWYQRA